MGQQISKEVYRFPFSFNCGKNALKVVITASDMYDAGHILKEQFPEAQNIKAL